MKAAAGGYEASVGFRDRLEWSSVLDGFDDGNLYQSWSYGTVRFGRKKVSHFILRRGGEIAAAAQVIVVKVPMVNAGIAYVYRGPMWKRNGVAEPDAFRQAVRALREEYVRRRGLLLRIVPGEIDDGADALKACLEGEGLRADPSVRPYRTLRMDLALPLETLRGGLRKDWKNKLNKAEKSDLKIIEGTGGELYDIFKALYREMVSRRGFVDRVDVEEFGAIQKDLPGHQKMRIMLCEAGGECVAALVWSALGDTGVTILRATGDRGLESNAAFLLSWRMLEWLKENGYRYLDLGGINPEGNPGVYTYKSGLSGKTGVDVRFLGRFQDTSRLVSRAAVVAWEQVGWWIRDFRRAEPVKRGS